jgi:hypothetical protein
MNQYPVFVEVIVSIAAYVIAPIHNKNLLAVNARHPLSHN